MRAAYREREVLVVLEPNKESKYEDILKRPSESANIIGRRPPAYLNYTKDGRLKNKPAAGAEFTRKKWEEDL